jgi:hypothetical protein
LYFLAASIAVEPADLADLSVEPEETPAQNE